MSAAPAPAPAPAYDFSALRADVMKIFAAHKDKLTSVQVLGLLYQFMIDCMKLAQALGGSGVMKKDAVKTACAALIADVVDPALLHGPMKIFAPLVDNEMNLVADALIDELAHLLFNSPSPVAALKLAAPQPAAATPPVPPAPAG